MRNDPEYMNPLKRRVVRPTHDVRRHYPGFFYWAQRHACVVAQR